MSQEEFQAKRDRFGPVRESGLGTSDKDSQFIREWQVCASCSFKQLNASA